MQLVQFYFHMISKTLKKTFSSNLDINLIFFLVRNNTLYFLVNMLHVESKGVLQSKREMFEDTHVGKKRARTNELIMIHKRRL